MELDEGTVEVPDLLLSHVDSDYHRVFFATEPGLFLNGFGTLFGMQYQRQLDLRWSCDQLRV
jgi:hypothetical protein